MIKNAIQMVRSLFQKGLFHVLGTSVVNKLIAFVANMLIVRILTKESYGLFTSAFNVYSIFILFSSIGMTSGILYFCSDSQIPAKRNAYYHYAFRVGTISNLVFCFLMAAYGIFSNVGVENTGTYVIMLALLPVAGYFFNYYTIVLRTRKENKRYALVLNVNSVTYLVFATLGSLVGGIVGTIVGRYLSYLIAGVVGRYYCRDYLKEEKKAVPYSLSKNDRKELFSYAIPCCLSSALNNLLYLLDVAMISAIVKDAQELASYRVATIIPENLVIIPEAIMIVAFPYFVEHKDNPKWLSENIRKLVAGMAAVGVVISALLIIFAPLIIRIAWGENYMDSVVYFRILSVSVLFLCFRATSTNLLACIGKVRFNLIVGIITGLLNIILDYVLIKNFGSTGAAIATVLVVLLASLFSFPYLIYSIRKLNKAVAE